MTGLSASLAFVATALGEGLKACGDELPRKDYDRVLHVQATLQDAERTAKATQVGHCNVPRMHGKLVQLLTHVRAMKPGDVYIVPTGWCRPPGEWSEDEKMDSHTEKLAAQVGTKLAGSLASSIAAQAAPGSLLGAGASLAAGMAGVANAQQMAPPSAAVAPIGHQHTILFLVNFDESGESFNAAVVNTGEGLEYHAPNLVPESGVPQRNTVLELRDIPPERIYDSAFWMMLMRLTVFPRPTNGATMLYERLLPFLNAKPLAANIVDGVALAKKGMDISDLGLGTHGGVVWRDETFRGDPSCAQCVEAATHQLMLWLGARRPDARLASSLLVRAGVCRQIAAGVAATHISSSDAILLTTAARALRLRAPLPLCANTAAVCAASRTVGTVSRRFPPAATPHPP